MGDLKIDPFTIPHDAAQPVGYRIECDDTLCWELPQTLENIMNT